MKAGLEVHQQLATGKLFCACPSELSDEVVDVVSRELRATGGENHAVDPAAAFEASRGLRFRYEASATTCLVELDEEPPHPINPAAVDVALTMARLVGATPLDEIEVMRKIVVDGSNTSGFQRTALIAVGGAVTVGGRSYPIQTICLEEDAARKISELEGEVTYRLDRLGIPLIEVATGPAITSGPEARDVAEEIGALLRSTGRVRRGIGSVREDLNVSTEGGTRVEIKGVQELRMIHRYVDSEIERQQALVTVREQLASKQASVPTTEGVDVTALVQGGLSGAPAELLARSGVARALELPGFAGALKPMGGGSERLGRELADRVRLLGLGGLIHSDERGVLSPELESRLRERLRAGPDDAFVLLVAATDALAIRAVLEVAARARQALEGVPPETRDPLPDGRTRYSRPLPGRDRMYPETDVPPVPVSAAHLARIDETLPESPSQTRQRLASSYHLGEEVVRQLMHGDQLASFESLVQKHHAPAAVARLLTQDIPAAYAELSGPPPDAPSESTLDALLQAVESGAFSKEGIPPVLREILRGAPSVTEAAQRAGVAGLSVEGLTELAQKVVDANAKLLAERGAAAFSALMGDLMRQVRGRRDGQEVAAVLRASIARHTPGAPPG